MTRLCLFLCLALPAFAQASLDDLWSPEARATLAEQCAKRADANDGLANSVEVQGRELFELDFAHIGWYRRRAETLRNALGALSEVELDQEDLALLRSAALILATPDVAPDDLGAFGELVIEVPVVVVEVAPPATEPDPDEEWVRALTDSVMQAIAAGHKHVLEPLLADDLRASASDGQDPVLTLVDHPQGWNFGLSDFTSTNDRCVFSRDRDECVLSGSFTYTRDGNERSSGFRIMFRETPDGWKITYIVID